MLASFNPTVTRWEPPIGPIPMEYTEEIVYTNWLPDGESEVVGQVITGHDISFFGVPRNYTVGNRYRQSERREIITLRKWPNGIVWAEREFEYRSSVA